MKEEMRQEIESAILHWSRNSKRSQKANYDAAIYYSKLNICFGIPVAILTTVVGTSVFATLESEIDIGWKIATGLLSILAAVLASLQTFLGFADKAAKHRAAGAEYGAIRREIEQVLITIKSASNLEEKKDNLLTPIRDKIDRLAREAPQPPEWIHKKKRKLMPEKDFADYFPKGNDNTP